MEKEVSSAVQLAVTLIAISVVLMLVMGTVYIGNGLKVDFINKAVDTQSQLETGQLRTMSTSDTLMMPKAAIYTIIAKERTGISKLIVNDIDYMPNENGRWVSKGDEQDPNYDDGKYVFPEDILLNYLEGKVDVKVTREDTGFYTVSVKNRDY